MDQIDQILEKTDGGLKVFQEYLGSTVKPGVKFKNPFYDDSIASCNLYYGKKCGRYFLVDFGDSTVRGDCFWFEQILYSTWHMRLQTYSHLGCHLWQVISLI